MILLGVAAALLLYALRGMDITITTTARTNKEAFALLKAFNFPFKEKEIG